VSVADLFRVRRMWRPRGELKRRYDVVIVGGGSHGLATAYYLTRNHGIRSVAVLEKSYLGSGAAGRNTAIIRSNYRTPEGARFYDESVKLYRRLSGELDFNIMFSQRGHLTLAHTDGALRIMQERAEVNQLLGIDSRVVGGDEVARICPQLDTSRHVTWPILGALYHPPGGTIRHDAVVWGFARGADRGGVELHPYTEVTGFRRENGRVTAVETSRGSIEAGVVVSAVAGWSSLLGSLAGVELPLTTHVLQALVTEPVKPFLDPVVVSAQMHVYVSQTDRGELLIGSEIEPYTTYCSTGTFRFLEDSARRVVELFPQVSRLKVLRAWTGLCDLSPDYSPILGRTRIENLHISAGWGTYGFKAAPIVGWTLAELVASGKTPDLIAPFTLERFANDNPVSELAAAAVSH
jgi:sarcosine oxidase subunit beta